MAEPTAAFGGMSEEQRAWLIDTLITAGHNGKDVLRAVDQRVWASLPVLDSYCSDLTCRSCGRKAWRDEVGPDVPLRDFHDRVLGYGGLPVSLIRWGMGLGLDESS